MGKIIILFRERILNGKLNGTDLLNGLRCIIIIMELSDRIMGVIVDEITDVLEIQSDDFQTTEYMPPGLRKEFFKGVGKKGDDMMIILLDMDRLLSPAELEIMDAAEDTTAKEL